MAFAAIDFAALRDVPRRARLPLPGLACPAKGRSLACDQAIVSP